MPPCTRPGPKQNFDWRLETPERAYDAGFRRIGIGALYGLGDWRLEAISVAAHAAYLLRHCWKAQLTISLPRLRPCAGEFQPLTHLSDRELVQLVCAFRLMFPDVGLVLSTRESASLRNGLIPLGITLISAGSHTEPGGYTGAGNDKLHHTERGRIVELGAGERATPDHQPVRATSQFQIADERSPQEVAELDFRARLRAGVEGLGCGAGRLNQAAWIQMDSQTVIANGRAVQARLPCSIEEFLIAQTAPAAQRGGGAQRRSGRPFGVRPPSASRRRPLGDREDRRRWLKDVCPAEIPRVRKLSPVRLP